MTTQKKKLIRDVLPDEEVDRLAGLLPTDALEEALEGLEPEQITGPGGLLGQLAGRVIETALAAELTGHLGYPPGQAPPGGGPNVRNGSTPKTVGTELGPVGVRTPRDRDGSFEPRLVGKRQTRLAGLDERVLDLYAGGMSVRDIAAHLSGLYGVEVGRDTISRVTDAVLEDLQAWRTRPLEAVYPIVYFDAMQVKVREDRSVRSRACYLAVGVTVEGDREALGIWWQDNEGAKFWLAVLNDLQRRGVGDVLIACVDGLAGFPEAIEAVFPRAWVQTCIVQRSRPRRRDTTGGRCKPRSEATLARVPVQGARDLRRLGLFLQRPDPPLVADGHAMDRVLQPLQERFKLVDSLLQGFDTPLMPRKGLASRVRGPPSTTQLNDTAKDRDATNRAPAWIAGARHSRNLPLPPSQEPREGRRKQDPTSGTDRTGLVTKTTRQPTCPRSMGGRIILAIEPAFGPPARRCDA